MNTTRRAFLRSSVRAGLALSGANLLGLRPLSAAEPFKRTGSPRLLLSLAAYSFRDYFKDVNHKRDREPDPARRLDLFQFMDYCAAHGCQGAELTSYYFPPDINTDLLIRIKRHAFFGGIAISGTAVGNNFTLSQGEKRDQEIAHVKKWVDYAQIMGAPHIRVFAGSVGKLELAEAKKLCIEALEECGDYAGRKGIVLGLENHGGIVAEAGDILDIVRAVKSPWVGINLDTGNFQTDDPYADLAKIAPYAVNVQMKGEIKRRGAKQSEPADLPRLMRILRDANYQGYVALEYESAEDPWKAVPVLLQRMKELMAA
jgi:sugar phosphate isomerase/epimerase